MGLLTDRASLVRELYRLLNTDASDDAMTEHDATTLEGLYQVLQTGAEDAQLFLIDQGLGDYWLKTSSTLSFTGSEPDIKVSLPADFLRAFGDHDTSPLRKADGTPWGRLMSIKMRHSVRGNFFYFRNQHIYLAKGSEVPTDCVLDYLYLIPTLADGTDADFPSEDRPLIAAFAAVNAMEESWFAGMSSDEAKILRNLERRKQAAYRRSRRSLQPRMLQPAPVLGDNWIL